MHRFKTCTWRCTYMYMYLAVLHVYPPYKLHLIVVGDVVNHAAQVICIALAVIHGPIQMGLDTLP